MKLNSVEKEIEAKMSTINKRTSHGKNRFLSTEKELIWALLKKDQNLLERNKWRRLPFREISLWRSRRAKLLVQNVH
jgi:hypothetical protein